MGMNSLSLVLNNQIDLSDLNTCVDTFENTMTTLFKPYENVNKHVLYLTSGVSNLLTKCAKILAKNLEWAIIVPIFFNVLWGL